MRNKGLCLDNRNVSLDKLAHDGCRPCHLHLVVAGLDPATGVEQEVGGVSVHHPRSLHHNVLGWPGQDSKYYITH